MHNRLVLYGRKQQEYTTPRIVIVGSLSECISGWLMTYV